jgi:hypothetical protein
MRHSYTSTIEGLEFNINAQIHLNWVISFDTFNLHAYTYKDVLSALSMLKCLDVWSFAMLLGLFPTPSSVKLERSRHTKVYVVQLGNKLEALYKLKVLFATKVIYYQGVNSTNEVILSFSDGLDKLKPLVVSGPKSVYGHIPTCVCDAFVYSELEKNRVNAINIFSNNVIRIVLLVVNDTNIYVTPLKMIDGGDIICMVMYACCSTHVSKSYGQSVWDYPTTFECTGVEYTHNGELLLATMMNKVK